MANGAWLMLGLVAACGAPETPDAVPEQDDPAAAAGLREYEATLELAWRGQPVGHVRDRLSRARGGYVFERRETWAARRGGRATGGALALRIETDADLEARRVEVTGGAGGDGSARRDGDAWVIEVAGEPPRRAPGEAVPAELVPLWMAQRGAARFRGPVLMSGMAFAPAAMTATLVAERELEVRIVAAAGEATTRVFLRADRTVDHVVGGDVEGWRVERPRALADPPDLIGSSTLDVGDLDARAQHALAGAPPAALPALAVPDPPPSPEVAAAAARVPGGAVALARAVADLVEDDLTGAAVSGADQVLARRRGDCVAHAVLFSAMARARGIPVRLVTGFRLEGHALVRHQWAIVEEGGARLAIDPTGGGAAEPGRYLPLAVHGSSAAERALAAELAYTRFAAAR